MLFRSTALTLLAVLAPAVASAAKGPWQISSLMTYHPSGRSAEADTSTLNFNLYPAKTDDDFVRCASNWTFLHPPAPPWGESRKCTKDPAHADLKGEWSFKVVKPAEPSDDPMGVDHPDIYSNFDVVVTNAIKPDKRYQATFHFEAGINMQMVCGASGVCSVTQKPDFVGATPVEAHV